MSGETYAIVFNGGIVEGFAADTVKAQLAKLLKTDAKKTAALFSGKQIILKKTTDRAEAAKYGKALKKVGADVKIRIIKAAPRPLLRLQLLLFQNQAFQNQPQRSTAPPKASRSASKTSSACGRNAVRARSTCHRHFRHFTRAK